MQIALFLKNSLLKKRRLIAFSFLMPFFNTSAQSNLILNGDFIEKTLFFHRVNSSNSLEQVAGWSEINTADFFTDTLDGNVEYVRIRLPMVTEMIIGNLTKNLDSETVYEFSIMVHQDQKTKTIPLSALLVMDGDTLFTEWYIYDIATKRPVISPVYDEELNKNNDSKWKWYSVKFRADKPYTKIVIGDILRQYNKKSKERLLHLDHIHLYQLTESKERDKTIQFRK